jgi:hypothetical protein
VNCIPAEFEILIYWMTERDRVRALKEAGAPKSWTTDPLLRDYRWCNVRRMDDRVSRWLLANWYDDRHDPENQLLDAVYARLINWPDSLAEISESRSPEDARRVLAARAARGDKVFTGAYVIPGTPGKNKVDSIIDLIASIEARSQELIGRPSMRETWSALTKFDGLGAFLAGQIVTDLARQGMGMEWPDAATWAPIGPGSARGVNRLLGRPTIRPVSKLEFEHFMPKLIAILEPRVQDLWRDRGLVAMDIQNCLCEFDKYRRLQLGEGKVRARYDGKGPGPQGALL